MSELRKIGKSTITYLFGSVSSRLIGLLMLRVYTSHISPDDFGKYDVSITYVTLISSIIFLDIWSGIMRYMFDFSDESDKYKVIYNGGVIFIASTLVYTITFFIIASLIGLEYAGYVYAYGLAICFQNLFGYIARAFGNNLRFAISGLVATVINACVNITLIIALGLDYKVLYIAYVAGIIVQCILIEYKIKIISNIIKLTIDWRITKEMFKFSLPLSINSAAYWVLGSYGTIVIFNQLGSEYSGYYAVASKFSVMITLVSYAFSMAWQEVAFGKAKQDSETGVFYSKATDMYLKLLFCGSLILIPFIYIIFPYFVTESYYDAKAIIPMYIFATMLSILATFLGNILIAYKKTTTLFISTLIASIVNIFVLKILISQIGLMAAPIALLLGWATNCFIRVLLIKKNILYKFYLKKLAYILPLSFATVLAYNSNIFLVNAASLCLGTIITISILRGFLAGLATRIKFKR